MVYDFGLADFMIRFLWQSLISDFFLNKKYKTKGSKFKILFLNNVLSAETFLY